ncbi:MAG: T9SS type A sorting domain-containing protein [Ignavibacteria bacterium]|nr:T9SS type A sorting domain-containing protein [Ignavibacteria bacterium]
MEEFFFPVKRDRICNYKLNKYSGKFELHQNFPNPFNPSTYISFSLPVRSRVKLIVYDMLGREVRKLADNSFEPGNHKVLFDASGLSSGIYFYSISTPGFSSTKRMAFIK